ncbi:27 kDa hemolymph glycoprotein [Diabrotica virgifera virgifera]|uniref:27 kDa hemolymph protein-like n=1 Tax=Diabrotica virgifera virgifera TaxID=50390 RepID=A0ABM5K4M3_DIAVI|nr:27 kDa hemolymph glycoprotein [Diabrotica virgifera virgifera]
MKILGKILVILFIGYSNTQNNDFNRFDTQGIDFANLDRRINGIEENPPNTQGLNFKPYESFDIKQFDNSVTFDGRRFWEDVPTDPDAYLAYLHRECDKSGHPEILNMDNEVYRQAKVCLGSRADYIKTTVRQFFNESGLSAIRQIDYKEACKVWPEVHNCINPLVSSIKQCLKSDVQKIFDTFLEFIDVSQSFFCDNNADRISSLVSDGSVQCFSLVDKDLKECQTNFKKKLGDSINAINIWGDVDSYKVMTGKNLADETCSTFKSYRNCITSKLAKCKSKYTSKIADDYLALVQDELKFCGSPRWFPSTNAMIFIGLGVVTINCILFLGFRALGARIAKKRQQLCSSRITASGQIPYTNV